MNWVGYGCGVATWYLQVGREPYGWDVSAGQAGAGDCSSVAGHYGGKLGWQEASHGKGKSDRAQVLAHVLVIRQGLLSGHLGCGSSGHAGGLAGSNCGAREKGWFGFSCGGKAWQRAWHMLRTDIAIQVYRTYLCSCFTSLPLPADHATQIDARDVNGAGAGKW